MVVYLVKMLVLAVAALWFSACAGTFPQKRSAEQPRPIVEEDIRDDRSGPTVSGSAEAADSRNPVPPRDGRPQEMGESIGPRPSAGESTGKSPRRFIWKDQKGSRRGWEPAEDRVE